MCANIIYNNEKILLEIKPSKNRWLILSIYVYYTAISSFQWVEYSILTNIIAKYYHVSYETINWTGISFMIVWPLFVFPSSFLIDKFGLRFAALTGCFLTAFGTIIKIFSTNSENFLIVLIGQGIVALSQVFILSLPPKIAITWFKPNEISTVCCIGVFGMQLGAALGFLIPPLIVKENNQHFEDDDVKNQLKILCWSLSCAIIPACIFVVLYFPQLPKYPPNEIQAEERKLQECVTLNSYKKSIIFLITDFGFFLHIIAYGISYGIFSAFGTLLNQMVLEFFPGAVEDAGLMGLVMILIGAFGGFFIGFFLDKTKKYKELNLAIYIGTVVFLALLLVFLHLQKKTMVYFSIAIFGFFLNAYIPAGIELAAELTFPINESTTIGLLTATSQTFGVLFTLIFSRINETFGVRWTLFSEISLLIIGTGFTALIPNRLKRQKAYNNNNNNNRGKFTAVLQQQLQENF